MQRSTAPEELRLSLTELIDRADKAWHGTRLYRPDWGEHSHAVAFGWINPFDRLAFHLMLNAYWEPLEFELPPGRAWQRWIDTTLPSPDDITDWPAAPPVAGGTYRVGPRSVVTLYAPLGTPPP